MEIRKPATLVATALLFVVPAPVLADGHEQNDDVVSMVHARTCTFNDRQDMGDLQRVINDWNEWADNQGITDYFAMTMVPNFHGADTFEIGWVGASQQGENLGAAFDAYAAEGGELADRFGEVVTCDTHGMFASVMAKSPVNPAPPDTVVVAFRDCKLTKGTTTDQYWQAQIAWSTYMTEREYPMGEWIWYPIFGGGDADYDFKLVQGFPDHASMGRALDLYGEGEGWRAYERIMEPFVKCNDARVYDGTVQRRPAN